jgi:hypothetical protein
MINELANVISETLDWTEDRKQSEIQRTVQILERDHGVTL